MRRSGDACSALAEGGGLERGHAGSLMLKVDMSRVRKEGLGTFSGFAMLWTWGCVMDEGVDEAVYSSWLV